MALYVDDLPVRVIQSKRKTISMELKEKEIVVKCPIGFRETEIKSFLNKNRKWISKHRKILEERNKERKHLVPFTDDEIRSMTEKAMIVIPEKVKHYAGLIGVDYGRITIRHQRTRWGSCSAKGNLNFNCLLMLFPDEVIDSVVVHELCHRKHMNHSAEFYVEVEKVFPKYKVCSKWLKENGGLYISRIEKK